MVGWREVKQKIEVAKFVEFRKKRALRSSHGNYRYAKDAIKEKNTDSRSSKDSKNRDKNKNKSKDINTIERRSTSPNKNMRDSRK